MFMVLTILFSALLSSTALRFLICSRGSAHLTARGVVLPSMRCFSSSAAMACNQQHPETVRIFSQPVIGGLANGHCHVRAVSWVLGDSPAAEQLPATSHIPQTT